MNLGVERLAQNLHALIDARLVSAVVTLLRPLVSATFKDGTGGSEGKLVVTGSQRLLTHLPKSDVDILLEHAGSAYDLYHETQAGKDLEQELKLKGLFDLADVYEVAGSVQRAVLAQASDDRVHVCFGRCE